MGWYAVNDGSIRSKGTMYLVVHPHGLNMSGRRVGLGYDGRIMTGWALMGQTREESEKTMARLIESEGSPTSMTELCEVVITAPDPGWLKDFSRKLIDSGCAPARTTSPRSSPSTGGAARSTSAPKAGCPCTPAATG